MNKELPEFKDPVQIVYALLCDTPAPPNSGEHWEGFVSRHIIKALREFKENNE